LASGNKGGANTPYELTRWQLVLKASQELGQEIFSANDIVKKVQESKQDVPATSVRTYVIAMAPNHPSYHHYQIRHPHFEFLGSGKYRLLSKEGLSPTTIPPVTLSKTGMTSAGENAKNDFLQKYKNLIDSWVKEHKDSIIAGRKDYRWKDSSLAESLEKRNHLTRLIVQSRIKNNGGVDLATLDRIMEWGFPRNPQFTPRDTNKCLEVTCQAFNLLWMMENYLKPSAS
jgi:hypothetical protein